MSLINKTVTEYLVFDTNNIPFVLKITEVKLFKIPIYYKEDSTCNKEKVRCFTQEDSVTGKIGFVSSKETKKRRKNGNKVQNGSKGDDIHTKDN